jgi:urease accessory protein
MDTAMTTDGQSLLLLLNWMSPAFPTGAFAYSHGLEWAIVEDGVGDAARVEAWIRDVIVSGSGWNDAVLFNQCWQLNAGQLNQRALAMAGSKERYLETTQLGRSFAIAAAVWTDQAHDDELIAYPIATATACKAMGIDQAAASLAFLQGFCQALVSVAVRLVPLGQTAGLRILRNLMPTITTVSQCAFEASLDDLGSNTITADIASMNHETQQPRIFRT